MSLRVKLENIEDAKTFIDIIDGSNTLDITKNEILPKLIEVFESKQKEHDKYDVPIQLRDNSIFVLVSDSKLSNWSIFDNMREGDMTITLESFKAGQYRNTTPKFSKLFKIPVPNCYKTPNRDEEVLAQQSELFEEELKEFRIKLPEFVLWEDWQIIEFGNDYNRYIVMVSSFQDIEIEGMRDVALAMVLYNIKLNKINANDSWFNDKDYSSLGCFGLYSYLTQNKNINKI
ncbi:MAG: hypothetical protein WC656_01505 [Sulfurimonas sp.]|jgi:hypothetical protein